MRYVPSDIWSLLFILTVLISHALSFGTLASGALPNATCGRVNWDAAFHPLNELDCELAIDRMREKVMLVLGPPDNLGFFYFEGRSLSIEARGRDCIATIRLSAEYDFDQTYIRWDQMNNAFRQIFRECVQRNLPISGYISNYRGLNFKLANADIFDATREAVRNDLWEQRRLHIMRTFQLPHQASSGQSYQASSGSSHQASSRETRRHLTPLREIFGSFNGNRK